MASLRPGSSMRSDEGSRTPTHSAVTYLTAEREPHTGGQMTRTAQLGSIGQSVWLDNITRDLLTSGTLERYIAELSVTGLTSNPSIYDKAIGGSDSYDKQIKRLAAVGAKTDDIFFDLALDDLRRAADMFL